MNDNSDTQAEVGELDNLDSLKSLSDFTPIGTPLTVPYFEVYRTDELFFQDYVSPYLNQSSTPQGSSNSSSSDEDNPNGETSDASSNDSASG